jgi:outer membrane protein assembly factor BamA
MLKKITVRLLLLLLLGFWLSACNTTKFLEDDELLLRKNSIKILGTEKLANKSLIAYELTALYKQKPNTRFFFIPREWFYLTNNAPKDKSRFDKWKRNFLGEKPAIFDETKLKATSEAIELYFKYKGYHDCEAYEETYIKNRKVRVTYFVRPKKQFIIDSVFFESRDRKIDSLLQLSKENTFFKAGLGLDGKLYDYEKERITKEMRNRGYAFFSSISFPPIEVDTSRKAKHANIYFQVLPPSGDTAHHAYRVGKLIISMNYFPRTDNDPIPLKDSIINRAIFRDAAFNFYVRPSTVLEAIALKPDSIFRVEDYDRTNRQLIGLGVFKFVRMRQELSKTEPGKLDVMFELAPNRKFTLGVDYDVNFTNRSTSAGATNLLGMSITPSLRNRNLFHGAESLLTQIRAGAGINPSTRNGNRFWNTVDLGLQNELHIPRFRDYLGLWKKYNQLPIDRKRKLTGDDFYTYLKTNAPTRITANFNLISYRDFLKYININAVYGFDLQKNQQHRYIINHLGIDYLRPTFYNLFKLQRPSLQSFLRRSLSEQLFVSILFREFSYIYSGRPNRVGQSVYAGFSFETAGSELYASNQLYNAIAGRRDTLRLGTIKFFQYVRGETDLRFNRQFTPKSSFASRFIFSIAAPFGFSTDVPYIKQSYVGGPNSIRGWRVRGLGPGGFIDSLAINRDSNSVILSQTGNLRLEFNTEYRFKIYSRLNGAIFLDMGNVWTLRDDPTRPGSQFLWRKPPNRESPNPGLGQYDPFYKQIAVGSGIGFRLDLTYFVLRFDIGIKLRYPYRWNGQDFWNTPDRWLNSRNFNLFLGLPF